MGLAGGGDGAALDGQAGSGVTCLTPAAAGSDGGYVKLKRFARMNAPKSSRSGFEYWRALSSDQP